MLKTMWNMPAEVLRDDAPDHDGVGEPIASGSLHEMVRAFDAYDDTEAAGLIIKCAGRDRPITWPEIRDLRRANTDSLAA